jgi:dephospho-CoA kinase
VARINGIVHPRVRRALLDAAARAEAEGIPLLVYEAALIFETGGDRVLDAVAVVDAPEAERIHRVTERDGATDGQVRARMGHQLPPDELRRRADYIIENRGSLGDLRLQVEALYRDLLDP